VNSQTEIWNSVVNGQYSSYRLRKVMWHVASGLSELTGRTISNDDPNVEKVPISQVHERAGGPEEQRVGIYLVIGGGLSGQAILIMPTVSALNLADLMMGQKTGTATGLGPIERSVLSEIGNMTLSYFLNGVASLEAVTDLLRPSPPAVMVDMLGAILDVIVTPVAAVRDDLLIIETVFRDSARAIEGRFWVLPDPALRDLGR
jgi:chemotaxis protein CheC